MRSRKSQALVLSAIVVAVNSAVLGAPTIVLSIGFVVCALIWATREWRRVPRLVPVATVAVVLLCLHFTEELVSGFAREFPALFGERWAVGTFVGFNVGWLVVFTVCTFGVARSQPLAFLGVLFLALIGGVANGIGHIVLSLLTGRVFAGTYTAPLLIVVGLVLARTLRQASRHGGPNGSRVSPAAA
jgi:hypothetical protein